MNYRLSKLLLLGLFLGTLALSGCPSPQVTNKPPENHDPLAAAKRRMIEYHLKARGIANEKLLGAFERVPREEYCAEEFKAYAYEDSPLPIGYGQTISQPYVVGYMTQMLDPKPGEKVLEIGTGSGYQAAILAEMGAQVYTIEIVEPLAKSAEKVLSEQGYSERVHVRAGDGYKGWPDQAPFDVIIVTAAPPEIPKALLDQLAPGTGRLIAPIGAQGPQGQELRLYRKSLSGEISEKRLMPVRFVPMVEGEANTP